MGTVVGIVSLVWEMFKFFWSLFQKSPGQKIVERTNEMNHALKKAREERDVGDLMRLLNGK